LRRDVDVLAARLKEGIDGLKHECVQGLSCPYVRFQHGSYRIQMDIESRKSEEKDASKKVDLEIEVC